VICEEDIQTIINWDVDDPEGVLRFIAERWHWDYLWAEKDGLWVFATGGWSGNEELIEALFKSLLWRVRLSWHTLYLPGGLIIIAASDEAQRKLEKLFDYITDWAWGNAGRSD